MTDDEFSKPEQFPQEKNNPAGEGNKANSHRLREGIWMIVGIIGTLGLLMLLGMQLNGGQAENPLGSLATGGRQFLLALFDVFAPVNLPVHASMPTLPHTTLFPLSLIIISIGFLASAMLLIPFTRFVLGTVNWLVMGVEIILVMPLRALTLLKNDDNHSHNNDNKLP